MALPTTEKILINKLEYNKIIEQEVTISTEYPVTLEINKKPYITIACSGNELEYYSVGYLISEGIIDTVKDMEDITVDEKKLKVSIVLKKNEYLDERLEFIKALSAAGGRSRKGLPPVDYKQKNLPLLEPNIVFKCMNEFLMYSEEHELTHGVHSSALYNLSGVLIKFFDEIGRHNAIDKIIGYAAKKNISLKNSMIFTTGRISSEIAFKIINARAPILVSRASPTSYSVKLLRDYNIIALARVSNGNMWILNGKNQLNV